nr:2A protein [Rhimavirus A]
MLRTVDNVSRAFTAERMGTILDGFGNALGHLTEDRVDQIVTATLQTPPALAGVA